MGGQIFVSNLQTCKKAEADLKWILLELQGIFFFIIIIHFFKKKNVDIYADMVYKSVCIKDSDIKCLEWRDMFHLYHSLEVEIA